MTLVNFNRRPLDAGFNNLVDDLFSEFPVIYKNGRKSNDFTPVNIRENDNGFTIEVVAPGFDKTDFKISLEDQLLTVSAEKKIENKNESEKVIRNEYHYRSFKRSFTLNEKTDGSTIDAKYVNGVLTLNLPKKEEVKPSVKQINIQ
jgi:HSP20 family protein